MYWFKTYTNDLSLFLIQLDLMLVIPAIFDEFYNCFVTIILDHAGKTYRPTEHIQQNGKDKDQFDIKP